MKLRRISFENFRSFKETADLGLIKPTSSFVGSNNAGKSNILEIFSFLRRMIDHQWSRQFEELSFDRNKKPIKLEIEFELDDADRSRIISSIPTPNTIANIDLSTEDIFQFVKYQALIGEPRCIEERLFLWAKDQYVNVIYHSWTPQANNKIERRFAHMDGHFHNNGSIDDFLRLQPAERSNTNGNALGIMEPFQDLKLRTSYVSVLMIHEFLSKIKIFGARRQVNYGYHGTSEWNLHENGENLIEVMSTILGDDPKEFNKIMEDYSEIIGSKLEINVPPVPDQNFHTIKIGEDGLDTRTDFPNISAGLHETLILVLAIKQAKLNEIICIEEPEIHLHSSAQKRLLRYILKHSKSNQFFLTTHSPIFTGIENDLNTYLITKTKGQSNLLLMENKEQLKFIRQQLGIRNSDTFGNDYVIFIEGDSEEYAFPILAEQFGYSVGTEPSDRIRLFNLKGNGIIPKLGQFLDYLRNSDVEVFLIADGDKKVGPSVGDFVREGRIKQEQTKVWKKEFEDTFDSKQIIDAMTNLSTKNGFQFTLTEQEFETERNNDKKVADIIQKHLNENNQPDLNKPDLAIQLANDIINEIKSGNQRQDTLFEKEVKRIIQIIKDLDGTTIKK